MTVFSLYEGKGQVSLPKHENPFALHAHNNPLREVWQICGPLSKTLGQVVWEFREFQSSVIRWHIPFVAQHPRGLGQCLQSHTLIFLQQNLWIFTLSEIEITKNSLTSVLVDLAVKGVCPKLRNEVLFFSEHRPVLASSSDREMRL